MEYVNFKNFVSSRGLGDIKSVLLNIPILHDGWEMDNEAWIVEMEDGSIKAITTSHGNPYHMDLEEAEEKLNETVNSAEFLKEALSKYRKSFKNS